jgi:tetratricopeptide (TPR) repeat protein
MQRTQGMTTPTRLQVLFICENDELRTWALNLTAKLKLPWRVKVACSLRATAPDFQMKEQDMILVLWDRTLPSSIQEIAHRKNIQRRSMESVLMDLFHFGGQQLLQKTVVAADQLTRDDAFFLAELKVQNILSLPSKTSHWSELGSKFLNRCHSYIAGLKTEKLSPEESAVYQFEQSLTFWNRLSDEKKMQVCDELLNVLGDSSRYCSLMAKRAQKEQKYADAEKWYQRAIGKNPNFLEATSALAELYMLLGRHKDALILFEKLKAYNPKNFVRLTKMAQCYVALQETAKAEKLLEDALSIDEFYEEAREELGKIKCLTGEYEIAKNLLSRSRNTRKIASFLNSIGIKMVEDRKYQESIEYYRKAQYVLPGNDSAHLLLFNIGLAYAKWGKQVEAQKFAKLALVREPNYTKATVFLESIQRLNAAA